MSLAELEDGMSILGCPLVNMLNNGKMLGLHFFWCKNTNQVQGVAQNSFYGLS